MLNGMRREHINPELSNPDTTNIRAYF